MKYDSNVSRKSHHQNILLWCRDSKNDDFDVPLVKIQQFANNTLPWYFLVSEKKLNEKIIDKMR